MSVSVDEDTDFALCSVRLRFRISLLAPLQSKMLVLTSIEGLDQSKSKQARRKIIEASWEMLGTYFAGGRMEDEQEIIFSVCAEKNQGDKPDFSFELDEDLKQELYLIDLEFSVVGK
jgi:hypothetical protein